ncbi:MAG TPA: hypothetical protein DEV93_10415 [Chloroflexi bacterium]|nr:hypothetical protein [Chloroflexota bacterium]
MSVGTTVAIVAAMIVGYGGLVALIVSQSKSLRAELKGHIGKIDSKIDAVAQSLDGKISAVREEVYRVGNRWTTLKAAWTRSPGLCAPLSALALGCWHNGLYINDWAQFPFLLSIQLDRWPS